MTTPEGGSVTRLIHEFRGGDASAFEALWRRYFDRLVAMATKLASSVGEDAALSAFHSFHRRARRGDFPNLDDRDDLWVQLMTLTRQKVIDSRRRDHALKRGGGVKILRESELPGASDGAEPGFAEIVGREPDPAFAAIMTEQCRRLLDGLGDETLREIALLKMGLNTHQEIAEKFGRSLSWVNRKLDLIRTIWEGATP
ncbi:MAG: sigma factor [Planctomycetota bacterium]|nr:sigma factor [Planctomycetota bacterium]